MAVGRARLGGRAACAEAGDGTAAPAGSGGHRQRGARHRPTLSGLPLLPVAGRGARLRRVVQRLCRPRLRRGRSAAGVAPDDRPSTGRSDSGIGRARRALHALGRHRLGHHLGGRHRRRGPRGAGPPADGPAGLEPGPRPCLAGGRRPTPGRHRSPRDPGRLLAPERPALLRRQSHRSRLRSAAAGPRPGRRRLRRGAAGSRGAGAGVGGAAPGRRAPARLAAQPRCLVAQSGHPVPGQDDRRSGRSGGDDRTGDGGVPVAGLRFPGRRAGRSFHLAVRGRLHAAGPGRLPGRRPTHGGPWRRWLP